ncbi:MAG TPA: leucyl/phenylalanyl-tRNA--protein transferase, partial [Flavisolibacter sp.]|nr:leucyl/phenylalanyl-tRNA--protein transferase [Flavisolibacter sp.]
HVSKSMKKVLSRNTFQFRMNTAFGEVINHCATVNRKGQDGTWITQNMKKTYIQLNKTGYALSAEAWEGNKLVGGMYGIRIGRVFLPRACSARLQMHPSLPSFATWNT